MVGMPQPSTPQGALLRSWRGHLFQHAHDALLDRVVEADIAGCRLALVAGRRQHAGMLAGAVVVDGVRRLAGADQGVGRHLVIGEVRAAFQVGGGAADPVEPGGDQRGVAGLAVVGGAGERQFLVGDAEGVGGAGFDQRDRLERLDRGAGEDRLFEIAPMGDDMAVGIDDGRDAPVARLDHAAARDFDQDGRFGGAQLGVAFGCGVVVRDRGRGMVVTAAGMVVVGHWLVIANAVSECLMRATLPRRALRCKVRLMRGYFAIGVEGVSKAFNVGNLVRSSHAFGASFAFTIDARLDKRQLRVSDTSDASSHLPVYHYPDVASLELPQGCALVGVELLDEFDRLAELPASAEGRLCAGAGARQPVAGTGGALRLRREDPHPLLHQCRRGGSAGDVRPHDQPGAFRRTAGAGGRSDRGRKEHVHGEQLYRTPKS